jgi:hypothetical protein
VSGNLQGTLSLSPTVFWLALIGVLAITAFQAAIIIYHWYVYAPNTKFGSNMILLYVGVLGVLLFVAVVGGLSLLI